MSWAGGIYDFSINTSEADMMYEIKDSLEEERGRREPVHLPLSLQKGMVFESYDDAERYLEDNYAGNRKKNYGVMYKSFKQPATSKKLRDLSRRIDETEKKMDDYRKAHSVSTFKATLVSCPECGSKINKKYIRNDNCPLCGKDLRSATTISVMQGYKDKIADLKKQFKAEELAVNKKREKSAELRWLIYAEAYLG